mmetsp:Transcript_23254/g.37819  ORF Transcript_23254/g.37819 Transcript_23254/m.37819 type:complete len:108 (-) Transcript_23254:1597-1920(-)
MDNRLAVGASYHSFNGIRSSGLVEIFDWIPGQQQWQNASLVMSTSGSRVVAGSVGVPGSLSVYGWIEDLGQWVSVGGKIEGGEIEEEFVSMVAITGNGSFIGTAFSS